MIDVMGMGEDESSEEEEVILSTLIAGEIAHHVMEDGPLEMGITHPPSHQIFLNLTLTLIRVILK